MVRTANSPQSVWQKKFNEYDLNPFIRNPEEGLTYNKLSNPATWWHNPINPNSLRLTKVAHSILSKTDIPTYRFKLTEKYKPKTFIQLERYFTSPYYIINAQSIIVYGEVEAMMIGLHGNDLQQYLDNQDK